MRRSTFRDEGLVEDDLLGPARAEDLRREADRGSMVGLRCVPDEIGERADAVARDAMDDRHHCDVELRLA